VLDWLLIGGGVHGTHLSLALTARLGWPRDRVRVLDPHPEPLALWSRQTAHAGMAFMRSSLVHHLALDPYGLKRFARSPEAAGVARFAPPYRRPSYALFQAHAERVVCDHALDALRVQGRAVRLRRVASGWRVETQAGALDARRVVLAIGNTERPCWPGWALALREAGGTVDHLFSAAFDRAAVPDGERTAVVGGGISAAQAATALARRGPTVLVSRHAARVHQLDADPGWLGPKRMAGFRLEPCPVARRTAIDGARHRGSVPPDVLRRLQRAVRRDGLERVTAEVEAAEAGPLGTVRLALRRPDGAASASLVDRVVLATGFEASRPGGAWLDAAVEAEGLPLAPCGFPRLGRSLAWAPGLYAAGPLAELELGPTARNVAGARAAADRLPAA
jgi:cation diffusion facilitator CzcD-associated flavoprotein CzcO